MSDLSSPPHTLSAARSARTLARAALAALFLYAALGFAWRCPASLGVCPAAAGAQDGPEEAPLTEEIWEVEEPASEAPGEDVEAEVEPEAEEEQPEPPDPYAPEREAEHLERRGEELSAAGAYAEALVALARQAAGEQDPDRAAWLWARAEFLLGKCFALTVESAEPGFLEDALAQIDELHTRPAVFGARVRWARARLALRRGDAQQAAQLADDLGLLRAWRVAGPFDNQRGRHFDTALAVETAPIDLDDQYEGLKRSVGWRVIETTQPLGFVNLDAHLRPNNECLAYALCAVYVPAQTPAALRVGSDDMITAWVNGRRVIHFTGSRTAHLDQDVTAVRLRRGWNAILLKSGEAVDAWGFYARLTTPEGAPLADMRASVREGHLIAALAETPLPEGPPAVGPLTGAPVAPPPPGDTPDDLEEPPAEAQEPLRASIGALGVFERRLEQDPEDVRTRYYLAWLLMTRDILGASEHRDRALLVEATERASDEGAYFLALAACAAEASVDSPDRDENLRRLALERAADLGEEEAAARVRLAEYYLHDMQNLTRARSLAEEALPANPLCVDAQLVLYDIETARGWHAAASARLADLLRRHGRAPGVLKRAARAAVRDRRHREALDTYRRLLSLNRLDPRAANGLVRVLQRLGEHRTLAEELEALLDLRPGAQSLRLELVDAYARADLPRQALAAAQDGLDLAPEDHEMLERKGRVLHRIGRDTQAFAAWDQALALQPSLVQLREYVEFLRGEENRLGTTIDDLREFVQTRRSPSATRGDGRRYLLWELADRIHPDGTKSQLVHHVVAVLNAEAAQDLATLPIPYEAERETLRVVEARALRTDGKIESARVSDYEPPGNQHLKILQFSPVRVGDVLEIAYRTDEFRQGFFGDYFGHAVLFRRTYPSATSRYILEHPLDRDVYVHQSDDAPEARETVDRQAGLRRRVWEMKDLTKIVREPFMPPHRELSPYVHASTFESWDAMARWYWHLIKDQYVLTPEIEDQVRRITVGKHRPREKLAAIYQWVATHVQNDAWEFGVHGYKPYKAETIFARRFGDCKDKTTLINVMARAAGLTGWPALLRATDESGPVVGRGQEDLSLPLIDHFNHSISAVRLPEGTVWLDGTARHVALDEVPLMDAGARAVIVTPEGARTERIPAQQADDHQWVDSTTLTLSTDGSATLQQGVTTRGTVARHLRAYFSGPYRAEQVFGALASKRWGPLTPQHVTLEQVPQGSPSSNVSLAVEARLDRAARATENALRFRILAPWLCGAPEQGSALPAPLSSFAEASVRAHDVVLPIAFHLETELTVNLPEGYELVTQLADVDENHPFGRLQASCELSGRSLAVHRVLRIEKTRIPRDQYRAFRRFCHRADEVDAFEFVLERRP